MRTHQLRAVTLILEKISHLAADDLSNILQRVYRRVARDGQVQALAADTRLARPRVRHPCCNLLQRLTHVPTGNRAELSYRESEILRRLCLHSSEVVTSRSLLLELWGDDSFFNNKSLHVFITKLRHRLALDARLRIVNVRGIGYKLISGD